MVCFCVDRDWNMVLTQASFSNLDKGMVGPKGATFRPIDEHKRLLGEEEVELRVLDRMVKVGLWCIQEEPVLRPSMKTLILMMEGNLDVPIPPCPISSTRSSCSSFLSVSVLLGL
ncbi:hypothetical protein ACLOJK_029933 [Asimina triloba]